MCPRILVTTRKERERRAKIINGMEKTKTKTKTPRMNKPSSESPTNSVFVYCKHNRTAYNQPCTEQQSS